MKRDVAPEGYSVGKLQQFTPEMMDLFKSLFSHLMPGSYLSQLAGGDESAFEDIEAPQRRDFSNTIAGIGNRYSSMGMGGQRSSGFQNEQTSAAQNFAQQLGAQRHGLRSDALKDLMSMSQMLLGQRPTEKYLSQNPQEFGEKLALTMLGAIGKGATGGILGGGKQ
jgi:hypothetical protein